MTTFRKGAISYSTNIDCETFCNIAFLLVFPTANGECSTKSQQKVRLAMFSSYFLGIIRQSIQVLCPVFSRKVLFRGDYCIGYAYTFCYKHDVNNNCNTDHWCNLKEKREKRKKSKAKSTELWQNRTDDLLD